MKKSIGLWQLMGFATTSLVGTLLHFLYEWTGNCILFAPFSGVNESTWEHMKLLFFPTFIYAIVQSFFFKDVPSYWGIKLSGSVLGLTLIPVIFYTYNGVIGRSPDWVNIAIFFIAAAAEYYYEARRFRHVTTDRGSRIAPFAVLCLIAVSFIVFTFIPPQLGIFEDPITGNYGI